MPKCQFCKEQAEKEIMKCIEKPTGIFNVNGSEKMIRKYYHFQCYDTFQKEEEFKLNEAKELDNLYQFLIKLHNVKMIDGRMFKKIQDLRNGTTKINSQVIKKYKSGVTYKLMLETYLHIYDKIDFILKTKQFQTKWNEFSYIFGMMINNINEINKMDEIKEKANNVPKNISKEVIEIKVVKKETNKKDELDISEFL